VRQSLLFTNVRVEERSAIDSSVILPDVYIGAGCVVQRAIVDTGGVIPDGTRIGVDREDDARRFYVTEQGVVLATRDMLNRLRKPAT